MELLPCGTMKNRPTGGPVFMRPIFSSKLTKPVSMLIRVFMETLLGYINSTMKERKTINYYYNHDQVKRIVPKEVIYGLYVLALSSHPNTPLMNYYKANPALLSLDCKYLLAAAYALSGDRNSYQKFLPDHFAGEIANTESGGSFSSDIRDEAMALDVLLDADPANTQIPEMAKHVSDKLNERSWYSTQELVFGFLSLGKIAKKMKSSDVTAEVHVQGKNIADFTGGDLKIPCRTIKIRQYRFKSERKGRSFLFLGGRRHFCKRHHQRVG